MYMERIVVGMDFSATVAQATRWIHTDLSPAAEIILVHAIERDPVPSFIGDRADADVRFVAELSRAEERLRLAAHDLNIEGICCRVCEGRPEDVILAEARSADADLIVIGPRGHLVRPWLRLGMAAEGLLLDTDRPLLLARGRMDDAPQRFLLAVDDSPVTPRLLAWAATLRRRFQAHIQAVHVVSHRVAESPRALEVARAWLDTSLRNAGVCDLFDAEVLEGNAADEILCASDRYQPDLLVIGKTGAGQAGQARGGRVVTSVARGAQVPILIVAGS